MAPLIISSQWLSNSTHKELNAQGRVLVWGEHSEPTPPRGLSHPLSTPSISDLSINKMERLQALATSCCSHGVPTKTIQMAPAHQEGGVYGSSHDPEAHAQLHLFHLLSGMCRWALQQGRGFAARNAAECVCHLPPMDTWPVPV